jgi:vacuolar-type H+-ATPase subunit C/Vma6
VIRTSRYAFILAKLYGILARSYVGRNYRDLLRVKKVADLYDLLFPGERPEALPPALARELEARVVRAGVDSMTYVLETLGKPVEILVHLLRRLEYQSVKTMIRGMGHGGTESVRIWDLGPYAGIELDAAGDYEKAIKASPYAWVLPHARTKPLAIVENMLDTEYYSRLLALARGLPAADRTGILRFVQREIALANVVWALRLRFFFGFSWENARPLMIPGLVDTPRRAVGRAFEIQPDSIEEWRKWRFAWLIEDQFSESFQAPDPIRAARRADLLMYTRAHQLFHQNPFTLTPLFAFFKLKEYETTLLKTAVEAIRLSMPEQEIFGLVGTR